MLLRCYFIYSDSLLLVLIVLNSYFIYFDSLLFVLIVLNSYFNHTKNGTYLCWHIEYFFFLTIVVLEHRLNSLD